MAHSPRDRLPPLRELWGVRAAIRLGPVRILRVAFAIVWIGTLASLVTVHRPDLWWPAMIGSDASNYFAAAERVLRGHELYALSPGDRPVPLDNAPDWTVPILSPPTLAVAWLPVALLPGSLGLILPWALGAAGCGIFGLWLAFRAPAASLIAATLLLGALALTAWSGNVNAILLPSMVAAWCLARPGHPGRQALAGAIVALLALLKVTPVLLLIWLIVQGRWAGVAGAAVAGLAGFGASLLLVGPSALTDYLAVASTSAGAPSGLGIPGIVAAAGITGGGALVLLALVVGVGFLVAFAVRRVEAASFGIAVALAVLASPVVRWESAALLLAVLAPWTFRAGVDVKPVRVAGVAFNVATATLAALLVTAVAVTGGLARSSMWLENATDRPVIIRFAVLHQAATFGFVLQPGERVIAWQDIVGWSAAPALVFDGACSLVGVAQVDGGTRGIVVAADGPASVEHDLDGGEPAAYDPACAAEARALLMDGDAN